MTATARHIEALAERIRDGRPGVESARRARDLLRLVEAGYESARTGQTVKLASP